MFNLTFLYLLAITTLSIALGIQIILLPWLVLTNLSLSSLWVGIVQASVLIPNVALLLWGGVTADRGSSRRWLVPLLLVSICAHSVLALVIDNGFLSIAWLCSYAVSLGVVNAFIQPWREYLLKRICGEGLQAMVAKTSLCLYSGQALGVAIAALMDKVGVEALLMVQAGAVAIAAVSLWYLIMRLPQHTYAYCEAKPQSHRQLLISGLQESWELPELRSLIGVVAFNGFFHIGVFIVAFPLLVKQVYSGTVGLYSGLQLTFVVGTIVTTMIVIYRGVLESPGRRILFGLLYCGVILLAISTKPTTMGLFILFFLWGMVVGVSSNMGRAVLQSLAPEPSRGRMISIYQLALFGSAPLGALVAGYVVDLWGVLVLLKISGTASLGVFIMTLFRSSLWNVSADVGKESQ